MTKWLPGELPVKQTWPFRLRRSRAIRRSNGVYLAEATTFNELWRLKSECQNLTIIKARFFFSVWTLLVIHRSEATPFFHRTTETLPQLHWVAKQAHCRSASGHGSAHFIFAGYIYKPLIDRSTIWCHTPKKKRIGSIYIYIYCLKDQNCGRGEWQQAHVDRLIDRYGILMHTVLHSMLM